MHRVLSAGVALCALPLTAAWAVSNRTASDTSDCRQRNNAASATTLAQSLGVSSVRYERSVDMHMDIGGGEISQQRVMVAFCRLPELSIGVAQGSGVNMNMAPFGSGASDPAHPDLNLFGGELQWRLEPAGMVAPYFSAAFGRMGATIRYFNTTPPAGATRPTNTASSAGYGALGVGIELNVVSFLRVSLLGGARFQSGLSTAGFAAQPFQGAFVGGTLSIGKF